MHDRGEEVADHGIPKLMTVAEAAERLRICEKTLRRHIGSGELACIALGRGPDRRRRLVHPDDLRAFIDRMREGGAAACPSLAGPRVGGAVLRGPRLPLSMISWRGGRKYAGTRRSKPLNAQRRKAD